MLISKEKMREILNEVYDEGRTSYEELKDSFIDLVISKLESSSETEENTKEEIKKPIYDWHFRAPTRAIGSTANN